MSDNSDVKAFHEKFEVPVRRTPQALEASESEFRKKFMAEELKEYGLAVEEGDLEKQFDALIDLVYVAHGTALMHGFPWAEGWRRVQAANMAKVAVRNTGRVGRHALDVVKPDGWVAPDLSDLVREGASSFVRPVMIVLEGPDGAGKSTLADALCLATGIESVHFAAPANGESFDDTCRAVIKQLAASGRDVIVDRFHLSERVYGPIVRGVDTMSETFEQLMWTHVRAVVVLCIPPFEVAQQNWETRNATGGEMVNKREKYKAVYDAYRGVRTTLPVVQYDYTRDRVGDVLARLRVLGFAG